MSDQVRAPVVRAAGAVLWRPGTRGREVALIHRPTYDDWTLPKGKLKNGEHVLRAAVREVEEETGAKPILGRRMSPQRYLKNGRPKQVEWWSAVAATDPRFVPGQEVDQLEWLPLEQARTRLTWPRDVPVLAEFADGPARTAPLLLVRHASTTEKRQWREADELRPLDAAGRSAATRLAELLASFGRARIVTSPTARCVETVLPYARLTGARVTTDEAFAVWTRSASTTGTYDWDAAEARLATLLDDGVPTIICTHGELAPTLLVAACNRLAATPPADPTLQKAAFWALHNADGRLAAIERHDAARDDDLMVGGGSREQ